MAATPEHLESLAALPMASCATGTGYCAPAGHLGVGVITHSRKTALEQVPWGHSLTELKKHLDNALRLLGCLILVSPFQPRRFCDSKWYCRAGFAQGVSCSESSVCWGQHWTCSKAVSRDGFIG